MTQSQTLGALQTHLSSLQQKVLTFLPHLLSALIVMALGFILAYVCRFLLQRVLHGLEKALNTFLLAKGISHLGIKKASQWISGFVFWAILILTLTVSTEILGWDIIALWLTSIGTYLPKVLAAFLIGFLGILASNILKETVANAAQSAAISYGGTLARLTQLAIMSVSLIVAVGQLGLDIEFLTGTILVVLTAVLAGAALAFGLGSKTTISNILAFYHIHRTFEIGQTIRINGTEGRIIKMNPTSLTIETAEGSWIIPAKLFNEQASLILKDHA